MVAFRYRDQERRNIAASEFRARNVAAVNAAVARREAAAAIAGLVTRVDVPATSTSTGTAGQIAFDATHFYACVATDTWVRAPLATW